MIASRMSHRHNKGAQKIKVLVWWYLSSYITALSPEAKSLLVKSFIMSASIYCRRLDRYFLCMSMFCVDKCCNKVIQKVDLNLCESTVFYVLKTQLVDFLGLHALIDVFIQSELHSIQGIHFIIFIIQSSYIPW